ncbi:hypothetical protein ACOSQ4_004123 [Xanthoceras sorbifolium]
MLSSFSRDIVLHFVVAAWMIRHRRNVILHGNKLQLDRDIWARAGRYISEFVTANGRICFVQLFAFTGNYFFINLFPAQLWKSLPSYRIRSMCSHQKKHHT